MYTPTILIGKDAERHLSLHYAVIEFGLMFEREENDRAIAIIGGTFLDTLLEDILVNFLVDDEKEVQRLLQYDQPMGTYGSRISAAYCLGFIGKVIRDDLRLVGKVRNRFAHDLKASFNDEPIQSWCSLLKWHKISMSMEPPDGATPRDVFQVGVNQLICHLNGIGAIARGRKCEVPEYS